MSVISAVATGLSSIWLTKKTGLLDVTVVVDPIRAKSCRSFALPVLRVGV